MAALPKFSSTYVRNQAQPFFQNDPGAKTPTEWEKDRDQFGRIDFHNIGSIHFARIRANPMQIEFAKSLPSNQPDRKDLVSIVMQLSGRSMIRQNGKEVTLSAGDWAVHNRIIPYSISNLERVEQRLIVIPAGEIFESKFDIKSLALKKFDAQDGNSKFLHGFLKNVFDTLSEFGEKSAADLSGAVIHLLRLALLEHSGHRIRLERSELMRDRVKAYVDRHLNDPQLSVDTLALAMNCSKGYLHKVFSQNNETISHYILNQRLEKCFAELSVAQTTAFSIAQIAFSWGFNSLSHFGKVFSKRYGLAPSQFRQDRVSEKSSRKSSGLHV